MRVGPTDRGVERIVRPPVFLALCLGLSVLAAAELRAQPSLASPSRRGPAPDAATLLEDLESGRVPASLGQLREAVDIWNTFNIGELLGQGQVVTLYALHVRLSKLDLEEFLGRAVGFDLGPVGAMALHQALEVDLALQRGAQPGKLKARGKAVVRRALEVSKATTVFKNFRPRLYLVCLLGLYEDTRELVAPTWKALGINPRLRARDLFEFQKDIAKTMDEDLERARAAMGAAAIPGRDPPARAAASPSVSPAPPAVDVLEVTTSPVPAVVPEVPVARGTPVPAPAPGPGSSHLLPIALGTLVPVAGLAVLMWRRKRAPDPAPVPRGLRPTARRKAPGGVAQAAEALEEVRKVTPPAITPVEAVPFAREPVDPAPVPPPAVAEPVLEPPRPDVDSAFRGMIRVEDLTKHLLPRYVDVQRLAQGGMGLVLKARDKDLDRDVAVKLMAPALMQNKGLVARFLREAQSMARLSHPNIVAVYDVKMEPWPYIVMEYLVGETLDSRLQRGPLGDEEFFDIALPLARGLAHAHREQYIHRDIKPFNIFLTRDGRPVWLDFGLARHVADTSLTGPGELMGTIPYMAPEQSDNEADARTDQYSFGLTLYQMLAGRLPFEPGRIQMKFKGLNIEPAALGDPRGEILAPILRQALEVEPGNRFATTDELLGMLEKARSRIADRRQWTGRLLGDVEALLAEGIHSLTAHFAMARFLEGEPERFQEAFLAPSHLDSILSNLKGASGILPRLDRIDAWAARIQGGPDSTPVAALLEVVRSSRSFFDTLLLEIEKLAQAVQRQERPSDPTRMQSTVATLARKLRARHLKIATEMKRFQVEGVSLLEESGARMRSRGVTFSTSGVPAAPMVTFDGEEMARELGRVFDCLLENAFQAGARTIDARWSSGDGEKFWLLDLEDDGPGFTVDDPESLFKGSASTKPEGTGTGLPYARRVLTRHGGSIRLANRDPRGARISLSLPRDTVGVVSSPG